MADRSEPISTGMALTRRFMGQVVSLVGTLAVSSLLGNWRRSSFVFLSVINPHLGQYF